MTDYAIVANGNFLARELIIEAAQDKLIVALDGAGDKLFSLDIKPDIILGDFDSIQNQHDTLMVETEDQQKTDLEKAIEYCDDQGATSITILCAVGGRLDHHESTMMALRSYYKKNRPIILHTEQQTLRFVKDELVVLMGEPGDKCGVIATDIGSFTSQGLEYEGHGHSESVGNTLKESSATLAVTGAALLIMPPQMVSQRAFMRKNDVERLEILLRDARCYGTK